MKKQSIRKQFAVTTILLLAVTILLCLMANMLFLEKVYTRNKESRLIEVYNLLETNVSRQQLASEAFMISMENACGKYNLNVIVLDNNNYPVMYSAMNLESLSAKLVRNFWNEGASLDDVNNYRIDTTFDTRTQTSKMEMWGQLSNGYKFLFSTPLESIQESVAISNRFLMIIGGISIVLCGLIAWFYSGKISNPILKLAELSEKITNLDFEAKYCGDEKNEIAVLGNNMNSLSNSLEQTISELKTANLELQQDIQQKEEIDKMRQEFISNVSHELKTPIALIQGYAEGLSEGITDDPESMQYYLEVISDEADRMNRMVKSLMTLNELESGANQITMEHFDLAALVKTYINNADVLLKDQDVTIQVNGPEKLYAWGDEFKVEEVVMNYFTNAVHYVAGEKKEIIITIEELENKARVTVFNTGSYIPKEDIPHVWDKFYKVDKARTRMYGGSGVGLSIVKAIMNSLKQDYGVENRFGGVAFWFELSTV